MEDGGGEGSHGGEGRRSEKIDVFEIPCRGYSTDIYRMTTIYVFSEGSLIAEAYKLSNGTILQHYKGNLYTYNADTMWYSTWETSGLSIRFVKVEKPVRTLEPFRRNSKRLEREIHEFLDYEYNWMIDTVQRDTQSVYGTLKDGRSFKVDYTVESWPFKAPVLTIDTLEVLTLNKENWCPALSGVQWLMMHAYMTPEPCVSYDAT